MKKELQNLNKTFLIVFSLILFVLVQLTNPIKSNGQSIYSDKPKSYRNDDTNLCASGAERETEKFCVYYRGYMASETTNPRLAADYRNKMLYVLKKELDFYYDGYKIGREKKTKWFQSVLDILGIGLAFTGTIVNGERAKTVIGAATGSFLAGRDSVNERFKLLQTKILTNKMDANRLEKWAQIVEFMRKDINGFPWDSAREELQQYAIRGTFEDALNSLVDETGAEVTAANNKLEILGKVSADELPNLLRNFEGYILPMKQKSDQLNADIVRVTNEIAALPDGDAKTAKRAELATLNAQKDNLIKNYQTISLAILASGDFATIQDKILNKPGLQQAAKDRITTFLTNLKNKAAIPVDEYDHFLLRVNGAVGSDATLNTNFLKILEGNKLQ